jgi:hypothetical protein
MSSKFALISLLGCIGFSAVATAGHADVFHPIIPLASDPAPYAGELLLVTVPFSGTATSAGTVNISSNTAGNFDILPTSIGYNAGDSSVTFLVLIDPFATGSIQISVSSQMGSGSISETLSTVSQMVSNSQ